MDNIAIFFGLVGIFTFIGFFIKLGQEGSFEKKYYEIEHLYESEKGALEIKQAEVQQEKEDLFFIREELKTKQEFHNNQIENFDKTIKEKCSQYPKTAAMMADLLTLNYEESANILESKKRPAYKEAERIRELRQKTREIIQEKKVYEYQMNYLRSLFPDIDKYFDDGFNEPVETFDLEENTDIVSRYISQEEYNALSESERNQRALDNYVARQKSKWQIGRDYELYTGYIYQKQGYRIEYNGIVKRLEDMGRDIIATKDNEMLIIQCKNWAKEKTIHENHIFQLYGTVVYAKIENPLLDIKGVFITTIKLSQTAKEVAQFLGIEVIESFTMGDFPRIKCNINRSTEEKIYHLPFDQQYDRTMIIEENGECFAFTVAEAEEKGFRRAWRHTFKD